MALTTMKYQGAVAPGSLIQCATRDNIKRVVRQDWGLDGLVYVVPENRIWRAIAIDQDSEASDVYVIPGGHQDLAHAHVVSNRAPLLIPVEGPLTIRVRDGQPAGDLLAHDMKLNLYPHEPGWLPDKRAPKRYFDRETAFQDESETAIFTEWFRGREGLSIQFRVAAVAGTHVWKVYGGHCHEVDGFGWDELATGTITATGDVLTHWEGRADAIKVTLDTTVGGDLHCDTTMYFRDEF